MSRVALVLIILFVASTLAGCFASSPDESDEPSAQDPTAGRQAPARWIGNLTEPIHEGVQSEVYYIEAEDGTQLSLTLHLPADPDPDAELPTLVQLTPYQSFLATPHPDPDSIPPPGTSWRYFVERGAAYVEADERGTNGSEGCLDYGGTADRSDARVFFDWIRAQDWSNGVIVTDGVSHPGMGSVVAHAADPGITGALAHAPVVSYYQDQWYQGAKFDTQVNGVVYQAVESSPGRYLHPESLQAQAAPCTGETVLDFETVEGPFTDLWDDRHLARHIDPATVDAETPILLTHGFIDLNVHPEHSQFYWDALPADHPKSLIMGYWYHGWPDMSGHYADAQDGLHPSEAANAATFQHIRQRWIDHLLFDQDNGLTDEPRVLIEDSKGTWHESHDWPLDGSSTTRWHADAEAGTLTNATPTEAASIAYEDKESVARGHWTDSHVAFRSEPLDNDTLVNGPATVHLAASSDQAETKWVAYLLDEAPDGTWERISHGYADSHSWGEEDEWLDMDPGTTYTWDIDLMPTAVVVETDDRTTLLVTSQDSPTVTTSQDSYCFDDYRGGCYSPSGILPATTAGQATNTVHTGPEGTTLTFHHVDPSTTQKVPWVVPGDNDEEA